MGARIYAVEREVRKPKFEKTMASLSDTLSPMRTGRGLAIDSRQADGTSSQHCKAFYSEYPDKSRMQYRARPGHRAGLTLCFVNKPAFY